MPGWTLLDTHPTQGRTFQRPLDALEKMLYLLRRLNGAGDSLYHYEIQLSNGSQDAHLFSKINIVKAWLSTKRRYPLVGATVRSANGVPLQHKAPEESKADNSASFALDQHFVVQEHDLAVLRPGEITFGSVASAEEAQRQAATIIEEPHILSDNLLVHLRVLRETDSKRTNVVHFIIFFAHHVTDGTSSRTLARCLLDTLARGEGAEPAQIPLEERLEMAIPVMDLDTVRLRSFSPAVRRWRKAAAAVIFQLRLAKKQGGHTLPRRFTGFTPHDDVRSDTIFTSLTDTQTAAVLANCRQHGITFGNAYFALAQVAMTRVLYRRYLRGEISEEEWSSRKSQPHLSGAHPLNLRPYLDKAWFEKGGGGELRFSCGFFYHQQPFMTLGESEEGHQQILSDGAPPFSDLLTFDRFLHRARLLKKQARALINHPLFLDIVHASHTMVLHYMQLALVQSMQHSKTSDGNETHKDPDGDEAAGAMDPRWTTAHTGSSMGNLDLIFPMEYPISPTHPLSPYSSVPHPSKAGYIHGIPPPLDSEVDKTPKIVVTYWKVRLRVHPGDLYLGAATSRGRMSMYVHYDRNVFEDEVVNEWLDELKEAVLWYLGQPDPKGQLRRVQPLESGPPLAVEHRQRVEAYVGPSALLISALLFEWVRYFFGWTHYFFRRGRYSGQDE